MKKKFEVINFIDQCRWDASCANNYGLINYAHNDISDDLKLLTHWISYITDRQMPFEQIWEVGGFVFSDMLKHYKDFGEGMNVLFIGSPLSFFEEKPDGNYTFKSKLLAPKDNRMLSKNNRPGGEPVSFVSRFYPSDYVSMVYTLHTLEAFNRDFIDYAVAIINCLTSATYSCKDLVRGLAYGLYILTYDNIGQPSKEHLDDPVWMENAEKRTESILSLLSDNKAFRSRVQRFYERNGQYGIKRVWCCLRDYIKSPEFGKEYFKHGLLCRGVDPALVEVLFSDEAKRHFELPGDVWNNNSTFRKCLLSDVNLSLKEKGMPFNKLLRILYEREGISIGYPEQFDATFDFVPRMCEKNLCNICPFKAVSGHNEIAKICANNEDKYCTVAMISGGYICKCKPDQCSLKGILSL